MLVLVAGLLMVVGFAFYLLNKAEAELASVAETVSESQNQPPGQKEETSEISEEEPHLPLIAAKRLDEIRVPDVIVPWDQAHQYVGKYIGAEGTIVRTYNSGKACFLNFSEDWRGKFHGVIFASLFDEFSPPAEEKYLRQRVRLVGKVSEHRGAPQIVVERIEQITLLDS